MSKKSVINKKVGVFWLENAEFKSPIQDPSKSDTYKEFSDIITTLGAELYLLEGKANYEGKGKFKVSWKYENDELVESGEVKIDKIWDIESADLKDIKSTKNSNDSHKKCNAKDKIYSKLSAISPETELVKTSKDLKKALENIESNKVVIKSPKRDGSLVPELYKKTKLAKADLTYPILVQSFLETDFGIKGLTNSTHTLRIVTIGSSIAYASIKSPKKGTFIAHHTLEQKEAEIDTSDLPDSCFEIINTVLGEVGNKEENQIIAMDIGYMQGQPYLISVKSRIDLNPNSMGPDTIEFKKTLAKILVEDITL